MIDIKHIRVIAFDADDTLWDCQSHFDHVEQHLYRLIAPYCDDPKAELFKTESGNMADLGYGCKAFTISVIETALRVGGEKIPADDLAELLAHSKQLLQLPATPLPEVEHTLRQLSESRYRLAVFTKGELQDQENKLKRSGLDGYFSHVEITSDKREQEFRGLCSHLGILPAELLMVGNSFKSDIDPVLRLGGRAVHIPFHTMWAHELAEEYEHENLTVIKNFSELLTLL